MVRNNQKIVFFLDRVDDCLDPVNHVHVALPMRISVAQLVTVSQSKLHRKLLSNFLQRLLKSIEQSGKVFLNMLKLIGHIRHG